MNEIQFNSHYQDHILAWRSKSKEARVSSCLALKECVENTNGKGWVSHRVVPNASNVKGKTLHWALHRFHSSLLQRWVWGFLATYFYNRPDNASWMVPWNQKDEERYTLSYGAYKLRQNKKENWAMTQLYKIKLTTINFLQLHEYRDNWKIINIIIWLNL